VNVTATVGVVLGFTMTLLDSPVGEAHPGERRVHNVSLVNTGNVADTIDLSYDSNFLTWNVSFDVPVVPLPAFGQVKVRVTLDVPNYVQSGEYDIAITGISRTNNTVVANTHIIETVEDLRFGVSLTVNQPSASGKPGDTVWWQLQVGNLGNVEDTYVFTLFGLGQGWEHRFKVGAAAVTEVVLSPGESEAVVFELDIPEEFSEEPSRDMQVTVKVGSLSEATAFNNTQLDLTLEGILDLTLDVSVSTNDPVVGKGVVFTVSVTNLGPDDADGVNVYAYFDIGADTDKEKKTVGTVTADTTKDVEIEWQPFEAGQVVVRIVVNPLEEDGTIWEISYDNNEWVKPMKVSKVEDSPLWEDPYLWLFLVVVIVIVLLATLLTRGRGGEEPAEVEVVEEGDEEEYEEGDEEEYEGDEEEYEEDEEEYEEDEGDEGDEEEYEDEPPEPAPAYRMEEEEESEPDRSAFTVGRM
jgi:hypothetical protein